MADTIVSTSNIASGNGTYVFPSSSSDGVGKLLTEGNIRDIPGKITTRNYKVNHSDFTCSIVQETSGITITSGTAIINGYRVVIPNNLSLGTQLDEFDLPDVGKSDVYNINLKLAVQSSTGGYIADVSNTSDYGVVYIEFEKKPNNYDTIYDYLKNNSESFNHYKPSMQRKSSVEETAESKGRFELFDGSTDTSVIPSQNEFTFTSLNWVIKKYDALFSTQLNSSDTNVNLSVLPFNKADNNGNPTLELTLGYVTISNNGGNAEISDVGTYDCTYRIDIDNVYVGNESLQSYLKSSDYFLKSFGNNTVTSIRKPIDDVNNTGDLQEIPFVNTLDAVMAKYTDNDGNTIYDDEYMYFLNSYVGETYDEEVDSETGTKSLGGNDVERLQSIVECSVSSVPQDPATPEDKNIFSSQVVNSASYNGCYTSYAYNLIQRDYGDGDFVDKKCKLNKYYVGIKDIGDYITDGVSNEAPPFGLFSETNNGSAILLSNVYNGETTKETIELLANSSRVILSSNYQKSNVDGKYLNNGNTFEVLTDRATFNIYDDNDVVSEVGFMGSDGDALLSFTKYDKDSTTGETSEISSYVFLGESDATNDSPTIEFSDNVKVDKYIRAERVYNAVYNDYAEWYNSNDADKIQAGDLIYYDPDTDSYTNHSDSPKTVVGICSDNYGIIVGGKDIPNIEENRKEFVPVSLCGRVPVKVSNANIFEPGDFIYASGTNYAIRVGKSIVGKFLKKIDDNTALAQVYLG